MNNNPISTATQAYKTVTMSPLGSSLLLGGVAFGAGTLGWNRLTETARALLRRPAMYMTGMTSQEFDEEVDDIKKDKKLRWLIPGALSAGVLGLSLLASHRKNEEYGGLLQWNAPKRDVDPNTYRGYTMPGSQNVKTASLQKLASDMFEYSGYVPQVDFSQIVDVPYTKQQFFSNDPFLQNQPYVQAFGKSILTDAQNRYGAANVPLGNIYDSAVNKFKDKFSFSGITNMVAKTTMANLASDLFATAVGAVTGLSKENQDKIKEIGTWAGAISSIIS